MVIREIFARSNGSAGNATARLDGLTIRRSVSPSTAGCSCSSFSMKWRKLPLPTVAPECAVCLTSRFTSAPEASKNRASDRPTATQSPSFR